jgi:hypothetical protein
VTDPKEMASAIRQAIATGQARYYDTQGRRVDPRQAWKASSVAFKPGFCSWGIPEVDQAFRVALRGLIGREINVLVGFPTDKTEGNINRPRPEAQDDDLDPKHFPPIRG